MVAQACVQTYTPQIKQIGGVYTAIEERDKGYTAVKAYTALGFGHYDDYLIIRCSQSS